MKKYLFSLFTALIIGFFLCSIFLRQYNDYEGVKVSNNGEELYFVQYGVYSSLESLEENTINLQNYVYNENDNLYYVYVGITKLKENADKIVKYYNDLGYDAIIKKFNITSTSFVEELNNYDEVLKNTNDNTVIASMISQVLSKYEEVVINGKN